MKWLHCSKLFSLVVLFVFAPLVVAAPVTFDFSQYRSYSSSGHEFTGSDGTSVVDVTPWSESGTAYLASSNSYGLYVYNCAEGRRRCHDNHQIDGRGPNESVVLNFGREIKLLSATFSYIGSNDDFTLHVDGQSMFDDVDPGDSFFSTYNFGDTVMGTEFSFLADHHSDDFKLYSVTADFVSNVPEPATLSLLGLGLAALGSIRPRK